MLTVLAGFLGVLLTIWLWWRRGGRYWAGEGVPSLSPSFPWGNVADLVWMRTTIGELHRNVYRMFPEARACGFYKFWTPCLLLRDPELIKTVMVKEFSKFRNNDFRVAGALDPLMALNPFAIYTDEWKKVRAIQLPMQTPNKVRQMYPDILKAAKSLSRYLHRNTDKEMEAKILASKYTGDSVATCAFGVESDSFQNEGDFGNAAKGEVFASRYLDNLAVLSAMMAPALAKILRLRVIRKELSDYFIGTVKTATEHRLKENLRRNDFLQQLIDRNASQDKPAFSPVEMAAHCMTFYMDGYETTGLVIAWALWELAVNGEVQDRLREEIRSVGSHIEDFEDLSKLPYLDAVVSETLRLHPPIQSVTRVCNEETILDCRGSAGVKVRTGTSVVIPILALHTDPQYFPEPERFSPDRFLGGQHIPKYAYIPYGEGPRICVGMKFALMQIKTALIAVLLGHRVEACHSRVALDPLSTFLHTPKGGLWLKFRPEKNLTG